MKKYIKTIKNLFVVILLTTVVASCTKDLNIVPQDKKTVLSDVLFKNESAYLDVLAGIYANLSLTGIDGPGSSNIEGLDAGTSQYGRVLLYLQTLSPFFNSYYSFVIDNYDKEPSLCGLLYNNLLNSKGA